MLFNTAFLSSTEHFQTQTSSVVILNSLLLQDLEATPRVGRCKERFSSCGKIDYSWSELLEIWSQLIAFASQMVHYNPKTMQVSGGGSSLSLLACFAEWISETRMAEWLFPTYGRRCSFLMDVACPWTQAEGAAPAHGLGEWCPSHPALVP